jgi:ParB-like chromosome segregation protein Spo0J
MQAAIDSPYQLFPTLTDEEYAALKADIAERGVMVPIELDENGCILDGHHRVRAWTELRAEGVKVGDYPRVIRVSMTEEQKRNHVRKLNILRRHLSRTQRDTVIAEMLQDGMSTRQVAEVVGVSKSTVNNIGVQNWTPDAAPAKVNGRDGKQYPAKQTPREKTPSIFANTARDEERAKQAAQHIEDAPTDKVLTTNRAARIARENVAQERAQRVTGDVIAGTARLILGDFRERGAELADRSVDLIFTDPPYPEEYLPLWRDLGQFAARVLKPDGLLLAYTGAMYLPAILNMLGESLEYWWAGSIVLDGPHSRVYARQIAQGSKPLLFYVPTGGKPRAWFEDTYKSEGAQKDAHDWQQSIGAAEYYIKTFTQPGESVVDPFLGGGTTGVAAIRLGRVFTGCEIDPAAFSEAQERISEYLHA